MLRDAVFACAPWCAMLVAACLGLAGLVRCGGRKGDCLEQRLARLHRDEAGAVQSLSFVLTIPFFVLLMLFVVQVSQVMIAQVVVHYAAYAAARSAAVWIPAQVSEREPANCISSRRQIGQTPQGTIYRIAPRGEKFEKIRAAAVMACAPLGPSRAIAGAGGRDARADLLLAASQSLSPETQPSATLRRRLANKLRYSEAATRLELTFLQPSQEPELRHYIEWIDADGNRRWRDFEDNELGWQAQVTATVTHDFALLPGPARFLATPAGSAAGDAVAARILQRYGAYVLPVTASATLGIDGEKSVRPFWQGR